MLHLLPALFACCAHACPDTPPSPKFTCAQQRSWGKCAEPWMKGHCCQTCFACSSGCGAAPSLPTPSPADPTPAPAPLAPPADRGATGATKQLLETLRAASASDAFLFGHHNTNYEGQNFRDPTGAGMRSDVAAGTNGSFPAMYGYNLDWVARATTNANVTALAMNARRAAKGGVLHMFWQAANPVTNGSAQDLDGSPITQILPGGSANAVWITWMDRVAKFFLDVGAPAIFRPFHENTGGWFWWGKAAATPRQYRAAWNYTADYLQSKGVHSLLYAYAPSKPATTNAWELAFTEAYPGDDRVDIECFDHYGANDFHEALVQDCEAVVAFAAARGKVPAICEFGVSEGIQNTNLVDWYNSSFLQPVVRSPCGQIAFAYTWRNSGSAYWVPMPGNATYSGFAEFYRSPHVIFA